MNIKLKTIALKRNILISAFALLIMLSSCVSNKRFVLLQSKNNGTVDSTAIIPLNRTDYRLQINDILYISIVCDDEKITKAFSSNQAGGNLMQNTAGGGLGTQFYLTGYSVNDAGEMLLPILGKIPTAGKTINELRESVKLELDKYLKVYHLFVQLADFKFSIMGAVGRPGNVSIMRNQVTIIEAIANAGDFLPTAQRKKVNIIRQYPDGVKIHQVDMTSINIVKSPFYFIKPNDVIYVEPLKMREFGDLTSVQTSLSTISPLLNTMLIVLNTYLIFRNIK